MKIYYQNRTELKIFFLSHSDIFSIGCHNPVSTNNVNDNVKVPKLVINKVDGNVLHFMGFWGQFKAAIHSSIKLNNIDKFNYLICYYFYLTLSSENYAQAVDILHERWKQGDINFFSNGRFSKITKSGIYD